jgi:transcriptional regulator with XRE-family HTH domain
VARRTDLSMRLTHLRCALGLSLTDAAKRLRVNRNTIADWEGDRAIPTLALLTVIAQVYQVDVAELEELRDKAERARSARRRRNRRNGIAA